MRDLFDWLRIARKPLPSLPPPGRPTTRPGIAHPSLHTPDPAIAPDPARYGDAETALHIRRLHQLATREQWAAYRAERFALAERLAARRRDLEALELYLDVWYLDLNGPRNRTLGAQSGRPAHMAHEDPPFDPPLRPGGEVGRGGLDGPSAESALLCKRVRRLMARLDLDLAAVQEHFFAVAGATARAYAPPLSPKRAWLQIGPALLTG